MFFRGSSLEDLRGFPVGAGVKEIRVRDEAGIFRVLYFAKFTHAIYVLHCFQKKTEQTSRRDIELAKTRYKDLVKELTS